MSQRPGRTLIPSVEMTSASGGTGSVSTVPTALIRSPSMRTTLLRTGCEPKPSINVPPTNAFRSAAREAVRLGYTGIARFAGGTGDWGFAGYYFDVLTASAVQWAIDGGAAVVDARSLADYGAGHIAGALSVPGSGE